MINHVDDMAVEVELLSKVGFISALEHDHYQLFQRGATYSLLIDKLCIEGPAEHVFNEFASMEHLCECYPEVYNYLLEVVRVQ